MGVSVQVGIVPLRVDGVIVYLSPEAEVQDAVRLDLIRGDADKTAILLRVAGDDVDLQPVRICNCLQADVISPCVRLLHVVHVLPAASRNFRSEQSSIPALNLLDEQISNAACRPAER